MATKRAAEDASTHTPSNVTPSRIKPDTGRRASIRTFNLSFSKHRSVDTRSSVDDTSSEYRSVNSEYQPNVDHLCIFKDQHRDTPNRLSGLSLPSILSANLTSNNKSANEHDSEPSGQQQQQQHVSPQKLEAKASTPSSPNDIHSSKRDIKDYIKLLLPTKNTVSNPEHEMPIIRTHRAWGEERERKVRAPLTFSEEKHALNYSTRFDKFLNTRTSGSGGIEKMLAVLSSPSATPRKTIATKRSTTTTDNLALSSRASAVMATSATTNSEIVPRLQLSQADGAVGRGTSKTKGVSSLEGTTESKSARGLPIDRLAPSPSLDYKGSLTSRGRNGSMLMKSSTMSNYIERENIVDLIRIYNSALHILRNDLIAKKTRINELRNGIERSNKISIMRNLPNFCPVGYTCVLRLPCCHYTFLSKERRLIGEFCHLCRDETRGTVEINLKDCYGADAYISI